MKIKTLTFACVYAMYVFLVTLKISTINELLVIFTLLLVPISIWLRTESGKWLMRYIRGSYYSIKTQSRCKKLRVGEGVTMFNPSRIKIGNNVEILKKACIAPLVQYNGHEYPSNVVIGNNVSIGAYDRIASMNKVTIDDNVLFAAFVHITDHSHGFENIDLPISKNDVFSKGEVHICEGAWLAFGCHILSGVTVGKHSVVAANSVVTKDVPDYSVVAGNPARIVRYYDFEEKVWKKVSHQTEGESLQKIL